MATKFTDDELAELDGIKPAAANLKSINLNTDGFDSGEPAGEGQAVATANPSSRSPMDSFCIPEGATDLSQVATPEAKQIISPLDGRIINLESPEAVDQMIRLYEEIKEAEAALWDAKRKVANELAARTEGTTKTRRIRGQSRVAVVEMPDLAWDQSILKEAWNAYPKFREQCLKEKVEIGLALREWKKIEGTNGPDDFNTFRDMIKAACKGQVGTPSIKPEKSS